MAENIAQIISSAVEVAVETACASIVRKMSDLMAENKKVNDSVSSKIVELTNKVNSVHLPPSSVVAYEPISLSNPNVTCPISLDLIKSLPDFAGERAKYISWRQAAKTAIELFKSYEGTERYYQAVAIVRNKIVGSADLILSSFNTVLNFDAIIARLDHTYSDKRPLHVLENQMSISCQGRMSISEYFDQIEKNLTLIVNKISMEYSGNNELINSLAAKYRQDALRVFISGLNKPICNILFSAGCEDLPSALAKAQELEANQHRYNFARAFDNSLYAGALSNAPPRNNPHYRRIAETLPVSNQQKQNHQPVAEDDHMSIDNSSRYRYNSRRMAQTQIRSHTPTHPPIATSGKQTIRQQPQTSEANRAFKRPRDSDRAPFSKAQRINFLQPKSIDKGPKNSHEYEDQAVDIPEYDDQIHFLE